MLSLADQGHITSFSYHICSLVTLLQYNFKFNVQPHSCSVEHMSV